jgi:hypothetical protein
MLQTAAFARVPAALISGENEPTRIRSKGCQDLFLFQMNLVNWLMWTAGYLRHLVHGG